MIEYTFNTPKIHHFFKTYEELLRDMKDKNASNKVVTRYEDL